MIDKEKGIAMNKKIALLVVTLLFFAASSYAEDIKKGEIVFKRCKGCHGPDGTHKAFGKSGIIAGQSIQDLRDSLAFYKESDFQAHSSTAVMAKQVRKLSDEDVLNVTAYISTLK
ncbi:MAG: c-type cytochrome [Sulfurospirillaceae bacterium]|nr:c-type cytochrome [Sulfurospirillaceae bacterium]